MIKKRILPIKHLGSRVLVLVAQIIAAVFFYQALVHGRALSDELWGFHRLALITPHHTESLTGPASARSHRLRDHKTFHYRLPPSAELAGTSILVDGYRHDMEILLNGRLLSRVGSGKQVWSHCYNPIFYSPLSLSLNNNGPPGPQALEIRVTAHGFPTANVGQVWLGSDRDIQLSAERLLIPKMYIPSATVGILLALAVFLAIDARLSPVSKRYFFLTLPHLAYAVTTLPEPNFVDSLLWYKLYLLSTLSTVMYWAHFSLYDNGLSDKAFNRAVIVVLLLALPYLFIDDPHSMAVWGLYFHVSSVIALGGYALMSLGWHRPEVDNKLQHTVFLALGSFIVAAGVYDTLEEIDINAPLRDDVFPFVSLLMTIFILVLTTISMQKRAVKLMHQEQHMLGLVQSRTATLERTQSKLLQHQRFKTLNAMGAAISHEIKNPLAALRNDFELMKKKLEAKHPLDKTPIMRIIRNIGRIDTTLSALTDYSKRQPLRLQLQDLSEWLQQLVHEQQLSSRPGLQLRSTLQPGILTRFDPELLHRALVNLLENATLAASKREQYTVLVRLSSHGQWAQLSVEDSGPGFGDANLAELCEPLVSGSASGLGLGLAIVSDVSKLHGGTLILGRSHTLGGASAQISLPISTV